MIDYTAKVAERQIRRSDALTEYKKTFRPRYKIEQDVITGAFKVLRETPMATGEETITIGLVWEFLRQPPVFRIDGSPFNRGLGPPLEFAKIEEAEDYVFRLANPVVKIYNQTGLLERIEDVKKET